MSKYKIRIISPEEEKNLVSWGETLINKNERKENSPSINKFSNNQIQNLKNFEFQESQSKITDGLINDIVRRDDLKHEDNLLKKDGIIKKEDLVRMKILTKARHSILKLEKNKQLEQKLELFNNKIRQRRLKEIVRAVKYLLSFDN